MGLLGDLGVDTGFLSTFTSQGFIFWAGIIFLFVVILIISGGGVFFYYSKKAKKLSFKNQVPIFMMINGKHIRVGLDWAREIFVPDSNISLFYLKTNKIYLARPTRPMGKNEYWYSISQNGEWVNFDLSSKPEDNTLARANYDHRDTRYAYINLKEIIKKNYKDKSLVWWKDPIIMNIISYIIMSIIFVGGCWLLISKMGNLIGQVPGFLEQQNVIADKLASAIQNSQNINSGVITLE